MNCTLPTLSRACLLCVVYCWVYPLRSRGFEHISIRSQSFFDTVASSTTDASLRSYAQCWPMVSLIIVVDRWIAGIFVLCLLPFCVRLCVLPFYFLVLELYFLWSYFNTHIFSSHFTSHSYDMQSYDCHNATTYCGYIEMKKMMYKQIAVMQPKRCLPSFPPPWNLPRGESFGLPLLHLSRNLDLT